jgi:hypothetical protein
MQKIASVGEKGNDLEPRTLKELCMKTSFHPANTKLV